MEFIPAASLGHLRRIERLAREIIPECYAAYLPEAHCHYFVEKFQTLPALQSQLASGMEYYLLSENRDLGYLGIRIGEREVELSKLYLLDAVRGKGFGQQAMAFFLKRREDFPGRKTWLRVNRQNEAAIRLYQKFGFEIGAEKTHTFENGQTEYDFEMVLNPG